MYIVGQTMDRTRETRATVEQLYATTSRIFCTVAVCSQINSYNNDKATSFINHKLNVIFISLSDTYNYDKLTCFRIPIISTHTNTYGTKHYRHITPHMYIVIAYIFNLSSFTDFFSVSEVFVTGIIY